MRILITIPHFFDLSRDPLQAPEVRHGSLVGRAEARAEALAACVSSWRQLFGGPQVVIDHDRRETRPANALLAAHKLDVVVCTTRGKHLLSRLGLGRDAFLHRPADVAPALLGFECHAALYERLGDYDFYCYVEDDLIVRDPWFFAKLVWFYGQVEPSAVLQPNRYEVTREGAAPKAYVDGDLAPGATAPYQDVTQAPELKGTCLGVDVAFRRTLNPHSACFFLTEGRLRAWAGRRDFLDRDTRFIGPLESAATLGLMRAFRVYKPAPETASFLEIEHAGTAYVANLVRRSESEYSL